MSNQVRALSGAADRRAMAPRSGEDDIYVDTTELSQWFPINITVALDSLDVMIEPREILPAQERARRESLRQGLQWQYREDISNARRVETPYAFVSAPYVGLRQNVIVGDAEGVDHQYDIRASADVVWMTGRLFVSGEDGAPLRAARVSLGREDPYRRLPGGLSSFTIGDTIRPVRRWCRADTVVVALLFPPLPESSGRV